uniref:Dipeptidyl peptidase 1 n=1 Tax=Chromera velia CCMP2878 TaxID=1169474 RepID=A0A0G4HKI4_9ALVE|eukprot:Cvel_7211.t1-p1 / transcript=Cvel_7211.t1 / gene=Cvel_7211 / organism=Chromera_velia_CCMP2878 / gene_product=Dipeptidyl peptidase 1, putative / transcript_product=Dipeptidyl peptidase 1, putative / location=Cvel_scaffold371:61906-64901(-) / protein_length=530 / sequence_SO=supercontig / SO=protein_coding / is_pseudo=false
MARIANPPVNFESSDTLNLKLTDEAYPNTATPLDALPSDVRPLFTGNSENWKFLAVKNAETGEIVGTWTTSFDEGLEVRMKDKVLYAFFKYQHSEGCPNPKDGDSEDSQGHVQCYTSHCGETQIGWHRTNGDLAPSEMNWGCWMGKKANANDEPHSYVMTSGDGKQASYNSRFAEVHNSQSSRSWTARTYQRFEEATQKELMNLIKGTGWTKKRVFDNRRGRQRKVLSPFPLEGSFLQRSESGVKIEIDAEGSVHHARHRHRKEDAYACETGTPESSTTDLPEDFSWVPTRHLHQNANPNVISESPIANQGNCGSCYAVASMYTLTARFQIALKRAQKDPSSMPALSSQSVLSCSFYNQGCDGGYPFLVGKHAREIGVPEEQCTQYRATNDVRCSLPAGNPLSEGQPLDSHCNMWYAKDYGYVGGFYQHCNEEMIMREVMQNGPVIVAVDAPDALYSYSSGILDAEADPHGMLCDSAEGTSFNGWEYTDHAVVIVGWGVDHMGSKIKLCSSIRISEEERQLKCLGDVSLA